MQSHQFLKALSQVDIMEMMDMYLEAKTGTPYLSDEILPVNILATLHQIPAYIDQYNTNLLLKSLSLPNQ